MVVIRKKKELSFIVPWGNIAGVAWGKPEHQRVFLVHGTMDNCDSFTRLIHQIPGDYYFVAIDLPGHGKSSHYPQGMNLNAYDYSLVVHHVLDHLEWNSCIYIGHSFGAVIGVVFSVIFPGKLERIVALDALLPKIIPNDFFIKRLRQEHQSIILSMKRSHSKLSKKEDIIDAFTKKRLFPLNKNAAEAIFERATTKVDNLYKLNRDKRLIPLVLTHTNFDQIMEFVKNINIPILLLLAENSLFDVAGERDQLKEYQQKLIKYLTIVEVKGTHDVHNNNPEIVAPYISKFLHETKSKL